MDQKWLRVSQEPFCQVRLWKVTEDGSEVKVTCQGDPAYEALVMCSQDKRYRFRTLCAPCTLSLRMVMAEGQSWPCRSCRPVSEETHPFLVKRVQNYRMAL